MIRFCQNLLTASIHGSVVILAVMLLRLLLKKRPASTSASFGCWQASDC